MVLWGRDSATATGFFHAEMRRAASGAEVIPSERRSIVIPSERRLLLAGHETTTNPIDNAVRGLRGAARTTHPTNWRRGVALPALLERLPDLRRATRTWEPRPAVHVHSPNRVPLRFCAHA